MKVWINGTFDILHIGHIKLFHEGSKIGQVRVGVDTDERVRELKGNNRPFNTLKDRIEFLESIKYIHDVVSFGSDDELIEKIKEYDPDYMLIGDDYMGKKIIGNEHIGKIIYLARIKNKSTTNILNNENNSGR